MASQFVKRYMGNRSTIDKARESSANMPLKEKKQRIPRILSVANQKGGVGKTRPQLTWQQLSARLGRRSYWLILIHKAMPVRVWGLNAPV